MYLMSKSVCNHWLKFEATFELSLLNKYFRIYFLIFKSLDYLFGYLINRL
jgi:hypothetical protein